MFVVILAGIASAVAASTAETIAVAGVVTCATIATGAAAYNLTRDEYGGSSSSSSSSTEKSDDKNTIDVTGYTIKEEDGVVIVNWC